MTTPAPNQAVDIRLDDDTIDRLAHRLAECLALAPPASRPAPTPDERKLTAAEVAERWGFDRSWVYQHSAQLGAIPVGEGRRPRLRFDPDEVERAVTAMGARPSPRDIVRDRRR